MAYIKNKFITDPNEQLDQDGALEFANYMLDRINKRSDKSMRIRGGVTLIESGSADIWFLVSYGWYEGKRREISIMKVIVRMKYTSVGWYNSYGVKVAMPDGRRLSFDNAQEFIDYASSSEA